MFCISDGRILMIGYFTNKEGEGKVGGAAFQMSRLTRQYKNRAQNRSVKLKDLVVAAKSIGGYYRKIDYNGNRSNMTGNIVSCPLFESVLALW